MNKKLPATLLGIGLAVIAAYLNVNNVDTPWMWIGVAICFFCVID